MMDLHHRCTDRECLFRGQRSGRTCGCHKTEIQMAQERITRLVESVVEMEAYNDVPGAQNDPVWVAIRKRGAEAITNAAELRKDL